MIWPAFWGQGRSDLYKLARDFEFKKMGYSANSYLQILKDNLLGISNLDLIFMQDNAFIHKATADVSSESRHRFDDWQ